MFGRVVLLSSRGLTKGVVVGGTSVVTGVCDASFVSAISVEFAAGMGVRLFPESLSPRKMSENVTTATTTNAEAIAGIAPHRPLTNIRENRDHEDCPSAIRSRTCRLTVGLAGSIGKPRRPCVMASICAAKARQEGHVERCARSIRFCSGGSGVSSRVEINCSASAWPSLGMFAGPGRLSFTGRPPYQRDHHHCQPGHRKRQRMPFELGRVSTLPHSH